MHQLDHKHYLIGSYNLLPTQTGWVPLYSANGSSFSINHFRW